MLVINLIRMNRNAIKRNSTLMKVKKKRLLSNVNYGTSAMFDNLLGIRGNYLRVWSDFGVNSLLHILKIY